MRGALARWFAADSQEDIADADFDVQDERADAGSASGAESLDAAPSGYALCDDLPAFRPRFLKMYRAFQEGQWHPDDGSIDWSKSPVIEDLFIYEQEACELRAYFIADFYYGEQFTLRGAGRRLDALDQMDEKLCYGMMIIDEHRHTEVFGRYQRKLGAVRPPDPRLVETLFWAEKLDVEEFILGAMILETIAVHAMPSMWRSTRDPLLRAFLPRVHKDETRHEAFSRLYLAARAARWSTARKATLSTLAADMFSRQRAYMTERNPLITFAIPKPIEMGLDLLARQSLRSGTKTLARRLQALGLSISEEMRAWT